jgi:hypothetical protein
MLELSGSPSSNYRHHVRLRHQLLVELAPRGSAVLGRQQSPRLGQDHARKAPPVGNKTPVDVVLEVVAVAGGKIGCGLLGKAIEPDMVLRRQVIVGKVIQVVASYRPAYRVELAVDHLIAPGLVESVKHTGELADPGQIDVINCRIGHFTLCPQADWAKHPTCRKCSLNVLAVTERGASSTRDRFRRPP